MAEVLSAGPFATEGERRAAEVLWQLPDQWLVVCNKLLVTNDGRSYEIDFIVVGERWVYVLDEKSWHGKITGNDQRWFRDDNYSERSPLSKADYIGRPLSGYLRSCCELLREQQSQWVRGGVILSLANEIPDIDDPRLADGVFLLANVCQRLTAIDRKGGMRIIGQARDQIKACLLGLSPRPEVPERIGLYKIEEAMSGRPGSRIFYATTEEGSARILMVYDLGRDPIHADELRKFYLREYKVLQELHGTGLVPEVKDPFLASDESLVVAITPPIGRMLSRNGLPETRDDFTNELRLAVACFNGLQRVHDSGIVHRALNPDAIYVTQGGQSPAVIFTQFFAARMGDTSTILVSLDALAVEDPYAAPEVAASYGYATAASDIWSLGIVFLERLSGIPISELRQTINGRIAIGGLSNRWSSLPAEMTNELDALFLQLVALEPAERPTASAVAASFREIVHRLAVAPQAQEPIRLDNRYLVERILGEGAMARTYLVTDPVLGVSFAVKQFLNPTSVYEQGRAEFNALQAVNSKHLPRIQLVNKPEDDVHVIMAYVPGPTLQELSNEFPWPIERWWIFAKDLLAAIKELEVHHLLHRDIKPSNIILHETSGYAVLIDFGLALEHGAAARPAGTPLYLPPESVTAASPPPTTDLYAAGVVLFKVLTGQLPFGPTGSVHTRTVQMPAEIYDPKVRRLADVLLGAVSNNPAERPTSASSLQDLLQTAMLMAEEPEETQELPDRVNPAIDMIRRLYRNSTIGNSDNRGLDSPFVRETYVPTTLDQQLLPAIFERRPRAVFLSGNPGDGKTAFLEQVRAELEKRNATHVYQDPSGWEWSYGEHTFRSCYDASEANAGRSADEQLTEKLNGLAGNTPPTTALTVLVAINDGRLADYFGRHKQTLAWLDRAVQQASTRPALSGDVWLVDLKRRAFVNLHEDVAPSVAQRVLQRLVDPVRWEICAECAAHVVCPMYNNALSLRHPTAQKRLEYLLLLAHLRQQRHTTMRDLRSAFAYLITGNMSCQQVHAVRHGTAAGPPLTDLAYWRSVFAPIQQGDELLDDLIVLDPARFPQPRLDRFLHFHRGEGDAPNRGMLFGNHTDLSPQRFADEPEWIAAYKRRLYFEAAEGLAVADPSQSATAIQWQELLPYRYADTFVELLRGHGDINIACQHLALGILRSDGVLGPLRVDWLSLKVQVSEEQQLVILKQFPLTEFRLRIARASGSELVEVIPDSLILEHVSGTPRLNITLDLFELLMRLADGAQPTTPEFQPLLEDLAPFKSVLLLRQTTDLVVVENQRREHHITQRNGKIVRVPASSEVPS